MSKRMKMVVSEVNLTFEGSHIPAGKPFAVTPEQEKRLSGKVTRYVEPAQAPAPVPAPDDDGGEVEVPIEDPIPVPDPGLNLDAPVPGQE